MVSERPRGGHHHEGSQDDDPDDRRERPLADGTGLGRLEQRGLFSPQGTPNFVDEDDLG